MSASIDNALNIFGAAGGVGGIGAILAYRVAKRQAASDAATSTAAAASSLTQTSLALLEPARVAAIESEKRAGILRVQITDLEGVVASLSKSLARLTTNSEAERAASERRLTRAQADWEAEVKSLRDLLAEREAELSALRSRGVRDAI